MRTGRSDLRPLGRARRCPRRVPEGTGLPRVLAVHDCREAVRKSLEGECHVCAGEC